MPMLYLWAGCQDDCWSLGGSEIIFQVAECIVEHIWGAKKDISRIFPSVHIFFFFLSLAF
jgi:hypothetical protein